MRRRGDTRTNGAAGHILACQCKGTGCFLDGGRADPFSSTSEPSPGFQEGGGSELGRRSPSGETHPGAVSPCLE